MGEIKYIKDMLAESPFFRGMDSAHLELLSGCGELMHFKPGEFLLREGEPADYFYLIRKGEAAIETHMPGQTLTVAKAGPGAISGYSWLFPPYRNQFDSRAISAVEAVRLHGKCLRGKAEDDHELGYQFMARFAEVMLQRMQATRRQMLDIYGRT